MTSTITGPELQQWCLEEGFQRTALIATEHLASDDSAWQFLLEQTGAGFFLLCALSCFRREADDLSVSGDPHGLIAPYTRRNYYQEAVIRLKRVVRRLGGHSGLTKRDLRIFSNSRLPEKALAEASGLGTYGKNSLILVPGLGSLFVIAGLFVPLKLVEDLPAAKREKGSLCGRCDNCVRACPVQALDHPGVVDTERCLQSLASREATFTEVQNRQWSTRLYGCQSCQEVCPLNRNLTEQSITEVGDLGPSVSLKTVLTGTAESLKAMFKGTQMGLSWFPGEAIVRNALLAAGNHGDPALADLVNNWIDHPQSMVSTAARWAIRRLSKMEKIV